MYTLVCYMSYVLCVFVWCIGVITLYIGDGVKQLQDDVTFHHCWFHCICMPSSSQHYLTSEECRLCILFSHIATLCSHWLEFRKNVIFRNFAYTSISIVAVYKNENVKCEWNRSSNSKRCIQELQHWINVSNALK